MARLRARGLGFAIAAAALLLMPRPAAAQNYPSKPITIVVPLPAGGAVDVLARTLAEHMKGTLGQNILVENVSGAGRGGQRVARAAPDGYTIALGTWPTFVVAGAVYPLQYDLIADFAPIALLPGVPYWLVGRDGLPARDLKELIAWLKANPAKATAATVGAPSGSNICGVYFQANTGTTMQMVPYRGGAPALQDLLGGQIDLMCDLAANTLPMVRAGKLKAYAVMAKRRWFAAPDVPTAEELGLPPIHVSTWHGFWAPRGSPPEAIAALNAAAVAAMADPDVRRRIADQGLEIPPRERQTPQALAAHHRAEIDKWWPIIKAAGIRAE